MQKPSRFFWPALMVLLILVLFIPNLILKLPAIDVPQSRDLANQWNPYYHFLRECYLRFHSFPLWNPYDLCGTPFLAFPHSSALYINNILYLFADFPLAMSLSVLVHLIVAGLGAYHLFRKFGASEASSFICGMAYSLAGFVFNNINFPPSLYSASFLPWIFFFALSCVKSATLFSFIGFSISSALSLCGGDLETTVFGLIVIFLLQFFIKSENTRLRPTLLILFGIGMAGLINLPLLLPAEEMLHNSIRTAGHIGLSTSFRDTLLAVMGIAGSMFYPFPIEPGSGALKGMNWFYLGLIPLLGFLKGLSQEKSLRKLGWIFAIAIIYAFFSTVPILHKMIEPIPVLGQSLVPFRLVPSLELVFLMIAAIGLDYYLRAEFKRFSKPTSLFLPLLGIIAIVMSLTAIKLFPPGGFELRLIACFLFFSLLFLPRYVRLKWLVMAIAVIDIYAWTYLHFPRNDYSQFNLNPSLYGVLSNTDPDSRYFIFGNFLADPELPFSAGMILKASTINSWTRSPLRNFTEVLALAFPQILQKENGKLVFYTQAGSTNLLQVPRESVSLLNLMNVRWLITKLKLPVDKRFDFKEEDKQPLFMYKNDHALDRAFLAGSVQQAGSREDVLKQMAIGNFDYRSAILALDPLMKSLACPEKDAQAPESRGSVHIGRPSPDQFSARTSSPCPSWFFSSETYYPGWKAFLDGKEARIFVADYTFRAVAVPAGEHEIRFSYQPISFRIGLYAGIAALVNILIILVNKNSWKKSGPTASIA